MTSSSKSLAAGFGFACAVGLTVAAFGAVDAQRLADLKAAGVVDDDTIVYLPMDDESVSHEMTLSNYAYGEKTKTATLYINKGTVTRESDEMPGPKIRGGYLKTVEADDYGSLHFKTNAEAMKSGAVVIADSDRAITSNSFTFECSMRWTEPPGGASGTSYVFGEHSAAGQCFLASMGANGKLKLTIVSADIDEDTSELTNKVTSSLTSSNLVDDKWHHIAVVVDRENGATEYFIDCVSIGVIEHVPCVLPHGNYNKNFMVGTGYYPTSAYQMNNGYIDNIRITGRVLDRKEFLCTEKLEQTDTLAWVSFEGDNLDVWPYPSFRKPTEKNGTSSYSDDTIGGVGIKTVKDGLLRDGNASSLEFSRSTKNYIVWEDPYLIDKLSDAEAVTVEFFAKSTAIGEYSALVALQGMTNGASAYSDIAAIQGAKGATKYRSFMKTTKTGNCAMSISSSDYPPSAEIALDGQWHHIAAVFQNSGTKAKMTGYYDHREMCTSSTFSGNLQTDLVKARLVLTFGIAGCVDEIRVSRGALTPDRFLRKKSGLGLTMLFR